MAYIIAVNVKASDRSKVILFFVLTKLQSRILADSGGTCVCDIDSTNRCRNEDYDALFIVLHLDLITATCAVAGMACILFGTLTNLPVCLA